MELSPHVEEKLHFGHKITAVVEAGLVQEFVKTTRVVALIEICPDGSKTTLGEQALLIFQTARVPIHSAIDLSIEKVLPIDTNLKCEIDTSTTDVDTDVLVNISSGKVRLLFEMPFSQRTNTFVSEVLRAAEVVGKRRGVPPTFSWLQPYMPGNSSNPGTGASTPQNSAATPTSPLTSFTNEMDPLGTLVSSPQGGVSVENLVDVDSTDRVQSSSLQTPMSNPEIPNPHEFERSPDMNVNRQNIAKGLSPTPIAARESHIRHQMALREDSYTDINDFTIFVGTWNVNGQSPTVGLAEWLSVDDEPPDVYAIGFQELDLNKETFLFNVTPKEAEWLNAVLLGVHPKAKYQKVKLSRLVGMMVVVLVQEKHLAYVRNVAADTVGTGIMNKMGNKGAVSIRMDLHSTSICFTNSHMAAHVEEYERRNEDHDCILQRTSFSLNINSPPKTIKDHEHIYFFGDMNYRIQPGDFDIKELASSGEHKLLLENDQLNQQRKIKRVFHDFKEGEITFKPSFKYDLMSDEWDSSEKARMPAWCDRILWHGDSIQQLVYRNHMTLQISDHKPVSSLFRSGIKVIDTRRYRRIYEEVMKKLDKLENEFLPQVQVDATEIILEPVKFLQPQTKYLTIANTGQVPVQFEFIKKLNDSSYCKPWLSIRPYINFVMPDECNGGLFKDILSDWPNEFHASIPEKIYGVRMHNWLHCGYSMFTAPISDYERSCFGSSINALVHMNIPFKEVPVAKLLDLESKSPKELSEMPYAVPKELWYLVDHLHAHALQIEGLFTYGGLQKEMLQIRACLDAGVPDDVIPGSVHSVAEALLVFLEALPEPVIPFSLYQTALDATPNFSLCKDVINSLPVYHRNVFTYLMAFLKELLNHADDNNLDAKTLAAVFGSILIRDPQNSSADRRITAQAIERKKQTFIHHFLVNEYDP
ncbi:unnamed protein product, partial [Meganyctiphanes norvegica]